MYGMELNDDHIERCCEQLVYIPLFFELEHIQHFVELEWLYNDDGLGCVKFPLLYCKRDSPMVQSKHILLLEHIRDDGNVCLLCRLRVQEHR